MNSRELIFLLKLRLRSTEPCATLELLALFSTNHPANHASADWINKHLPVMAILQTRRFFP
jgi:hypothetical protein